jgi:tRNA dimethylallyltransferase
LGIENIRKWRYLSEMSDFSKNKKLIVIAGPTAVGKTAVAIQLAEHYQTEIVSADSRQIFKELTIGTAKPSPEELARVTHHFIDSHSITATYDAAQFGNDALVCIETLFQKHDVVIVCGGSGLYIKALVEGLDDIPEVDSGIRKELIAAYEAHGIGWLQDKMRTEDPDYFALIDQKNPHRMIRALEVKAGTKASISTFQKNKKREHTFSIIKIGLELPREVLHKRIDQRMDVMIEQGLFEEAASLLPYEGHQALQTVGYQEIFDFLNGQYDREEAIRLLKRNSRRYAKRQLTWFKRDADMIWAVPSEVDKTIRSWL